MDDKELFKSSEQALSYAQFRPSCPQEVYDEIIGASQGKDLAVDVACGTGQSTRPLAAHFKEVIGIDVSEAQVTEANKGKPSNVRFQIQSAEDLGFLADNSVDLLTCCQAVHWLDRPKYYKEINRVLKPGGTVALYGYSNKQIPNCPEASEVFANFYHNVVNEHRSPSLLFLDNKYKDMDLPYGNMKRVSKYKIEKHMSLDQLIGYVSSWSSCNTLLKKNPTSSALSDLRKQILEAYRKLGTDAEMLGNIHVIWDVFILIGHK